MPDFQLRLWPLQVSQPDDFSIPNLSCSLRAFRTPEFNQMFKIHDTIDARVKDAGVSTANAEDENKAGDNYREALDRWNAVKEEIILSQNSLDFFPGRSRAQKNSFKLLFEWWHNKAYDYEVTELIRDWIEKAGALRIDGRVRPRIETSRYNLTCFGLWRAEFGCDTPISDLQLYSDRQMAAAEAASHRISLHATKKIDDAQGRNYENAVFFGPGIVDSTKGRCQEPPMSAGIESCSWIEAVRDKSAWPYYLWDRKTQSTVNTVDLEAPDYTAISHTWGRWRACPPKEAKIARVPWPIPENTIFEVTELPTLMAQVPTSTRWIWFDLLCIPQNMSDPELGPRAQIEIANPASIFRNAVFAVAWFNWIPDWKGLQSTLEWFGLMYAHCNEPGSFILEEAFANSFSMAEQSTHLLIYPEHNLDTYPSNILAASPSSWFTSLWTLQEVCLRLEMFLCDKNWHPLCVDQGFKVPLDHIISLWNSTYEATLENPDILPSGTKELIHLLRQTGMSELPRMSPLSVLTLGNQRYCESRRAEAIMSVVDAKSWFLENNESREDPSAMVLGKYPLAFVREVRNKLKGQFFATADTYYEESNRVGTLLPFSDKSAANRRVVVNPFDAEDHPAVETWTIEQDGSVHLSKAGIVAAYPRKTGKEETARILMPVSTPGIPGHETFRDEVDLSEFLASFSPSQEKYAICLLRSGSRITGFIIVEDDQPRPRPPVSRSQQVFSKIAVFFYNSNDEDHRAKRGKKDYQFPESDDVNWTVL